MDEHSKNFKESNRIEDYNNWNKKNRVEGINSLDDAQEWIRELKDRVVEIT